MPDSKLVSARRAKSPLTLAAIARESRELCGRAQARADMYYKRGDYAAVNGAAVVAGEHREIAQLAAHRAYDIAARTIRRDWREAATAAEADANVVIDIEAKLRRLARLD